MGHDPWHVTHDLRRRNPPGCPEMSGRPGRVAPMLLILYPEFTRSFRAARRIDLCIHDAYAHDPLTHPKNVTHRPIDPWVTDPFAALRWGLYEWRTSVNSIQVDIYNEGNGQILTYYTYKLYWISNKFTRKFYKTDILGSSILIFTENYQC